jgi:hypothetical protein
MTISKTVRIGSMKDTGNIFCKIQFDDGKLSITGVEGPRSDGSCRGSCGQIDQGYKHRFSEQDDDRYSTLKQPKDISFAPGWDAEKWLDFLDIWHHWHLNDLRPNCKHQVGDEWNNKRKLTLYYFRLSPSTEEIIESAAAGAMAAIKSGQTYTPTPDQVQALNLEDRVTWHEPTLPDRLAKFYIPNGPIYDKDTHNKASEVKTAGWVYPKEHPQGILTKPCPVCGFKYGNAWLFEPVHDHVTAFLNSLPDTDVQPAWV